MVYPMPILDIRQYLTGSVVMLCEAFKKMVKKDASMACLIYI